MRLNRFEQDRAIGHGVPPDIFRLSDHAAGICSRERGGRMAVSKTKMLELVKGFRAAEVDAALKENQKLKDVRDERGCNWLHVCCGQKVKKGQEKDSIRTATVLLKHGYDVSAPAFTEGAWKATPVWFAIGRGENKPLAEFLLKKGADPNHSLW